MLQKPMISVRSTVERSLISMPISETDITHEPMETEFLRPGVFVAELDRPWLETPFALQGFLIEQPEQVTTLQALCRTVYIDRRRSVGEHYAAMIRDRDLSHRYPTDSTGLAFDEVVRLVRKPQLIEAGPRSYPDGETSLQSEMFHTAPVVQDVQQSFASLVDAVEAGAAFDFRHIGALVDEMAASLGRNPDALLWLTRLKSTDRYSYDHALDVSVMSMAFGRFLGLDQRMIGELGRAGLLQDIGKVRIPSDILAKTGPLTAAEWAVVREHVVDSLELLGGLQAVSKLILRTIIEHHERFDGSGYPRGLGGVRISLLSEITGLTDTYCAMTRHRVYAPARSSQNALETLSQQRGRAFREVIVDQFVQCVGLYPVGTLVELNSGEVAIVIQQNRVQREKPRLMILMTANKALIRRPAYVDLMDSPRSAEGGILRITHALPPNAYGIDPAELFLS